MKKQTRRTEAAHTTRPKTAGLEARSPKSVEEVESFTKVAMRAGAALADLLDHKDCSDKLARLISRFHSDCCNEFTDTASDLRVNFHVIIDAC